MLPANYIDITDNNVAAAMRDTSIKPIALRKPIHWSIRSTGSGQKLLSFYTTGSKSSAGYHIGLVVEEQELQGQKLQVATNFYLDGEPGKSIKQRIAFAKSIIMRTPKGGYVKH